VKKALAPGDSKVEPAEMLDTFCRKNAVQIDVIVASGQQLGRKGQRHPGSTINRGRREVPL
jgi:hypothetical protein